MKQSDPSIHAMQVKFHQFLAYFRPYLSLPDYKFLRDITLGILKSNSVIINHLAKYLGEKITLKKTGERLYRHLHTTGLSDRLRTILMKKQSHHVDRKTLIIIDGSDIAKPRARKMEGLRYVRDASRCCFQRGYDLLNIAICKPDEEGYRLMPFSSELISRDSEMDSMSQILQDRITEIILLTGNKGTYVFDREYDSINLIRFMKENRTCFIIRGMGKRNIRDNGKPISFSKVLANFPLEHTIRMDGKRSHYRCGIQRITYSLDYANVKDPETVDLWLVISQKISKNGSIVGTAIFLCDFPGMNIHQNEIMERCIKGYLLRWKIEEMHRQIKQDYQWEAMQLMSYEGLKNLNILLWISVSYLYSLKNMAMQLAESYPQLMIQSKKRWKDIFKFSYYRLSTLITICFMGLTKYALTQFPHVYYHIKPTLDILRF